MADLYSILAGKLEGENDYLARDPFYRAGVGVAQQQVAPRTSTEAFLLPLLQGLGSGALMGYGRKSATDEAYKDYKSSPLFNHLAGYQSEERPENWTIKQAQNDGILAALQGQQEQKEQLMRMELDQQLQKSLLKDGLAVGEQGIVPLAGYNEAIAEKLAMQEELKAGIKLQNELKSQDALTRAKASLDRELTPDKAAPTLQLLSDAYDTTLKISTKSAMSPFGKERAEFQAAVSSIMPALQGLWKGPMSDRDMKTIQGLIPKIGDTKAQVEARKKQMLNLIASQTGGRVPEEAVSFKFGETTTPQASNVITKIGADGQSYTVRDLGNGQFEIIE